MLLVAIDRFSMMKVVASWFLDGSPFITYQDSHRIISEKLTNDINVLVPAQVLITSVLVCYIGMVLVNTMLTDLFFVWWSG